MNFGVPNQRRVKSKREKFSNNAVITLGIAGEKGTARSMFLNNKAVEKLQLPEEDGVVVFAFEMSEDNTKCLDVSIANGNHKDVPEHVRIKVTKGEPRKISEKRTYDYLSNKAFELNNSVENHFELIDSPEIRPQGSIILFKLKPILEVFEQEESNSLKNHVIQGITEIPSIELEEDSKNAFDVISEEIAQDEKMYEAVETVSEFHSNIN